MIDRFPPMTHATGAPVADNLNIQTAGPRGPALLQDIWLIEKLAHFDREVIPERRRLRLARPHRGACGRPAEKMRSQFATAQDVGALRGQASQVEPFVQQSGVSAFTAQVRDEFFVEA